MANGKQEVSVAGKSPDRSEQQMSSGEKTTERVGTVPKPARDPRIALSQPSPDAGETGPDAGRAGSAGAGAGDDEGERPAPNGAVSTRTAGGPDEETAGETAEEAAGGEAPEETPGEGAGDTGSGSGTDDGAVSDGAGEDVGAADAADRDASEGAEGVAGDTGGTGDEESGPEGSEPVVDQRTAVFRVPRDRSEVDGEDPDGGAATEDGAAGDTGGTEDVPEAAPADTGTVDQPTAVFRAVPPATGTATDAGPSAEPDKEGKAETGAERTSRFVPLKSADGPRTSGPAAVTSGEPGKSGEPSDTGLPEAERTRQQPLPPHRPLELLAELTNKPAPPPTPLRTALRRLKIWSPLAVLLAIAFCVAQLLRPLPAPELVLTADPTYSFEGDEPSLAWPPEGQAVVEVEGLGSLGSYGEEKPVPIASVAKVMTAYILLRDHPFEEGTEGPMIPVDEKAEEEAGLSAEGESTVEVEAGEEISAKEALNALMLASANNVARLVARWDAGSEKAFVEKMNDTAKELGMTNTTYTDASGLRKDTVSTAADQVKLGKKVMDFELFREVVKQPSYTDRNGTAHSNWNRLVPYNNAVGIKTGTTTAAGGNLLFAGEKEIGGTTQLIIGAVFGQHKPPIIDTVVSESRELLVSVQGVLEAEKIVAKGDVVGYVDDGLGGRTEVVATEDVTAVGWPGLEVELGLTDGGKAVPGEAAPGETVGVLTVGSGPGQVKVPVALREELAEPGTGARLTRVL
ncbi:serine hydrolase [Streptomyces sp. TRM 70361]|uniref:D-alanyl-D-alanine carboxypeptidase n=1 Tax=Streptomyces sp. TRM 70361 TaxID=3116553 RepID=UPI002E7BEBFF|nr:serine hydrolase [Streptomyces sp. TRM 70361]MEE1938390.1 serine hydrolase [Streptomyces sp. TRM 70361]